LSRSVTPTSEDQREDVSAKLAAKRRSKTSSNWMWHDPCESESAKLQPLEMVQADNGAWERLSSRRHFQSNSGVFATADAEDEGAKVVDVHHHAQRKYSKEVLATTGPILSWEGRATSPSAERLVSKGRPTGNGLSLAPGKRSATGNPWSESRDLRPQNHAPSPDSELPDTMPEHFVEVTKFSDWHARPVASTADHDREWQSSKKPYPAARPPPALRPKAPPTLVQSPVF